jgi:hypothetical protein
MMRDEYQSGLHLADVGFRFCLADRLRQCGEPDAGAGCQPAAKHFRAYRLGAPRWRQLAQVMTESTFLALLGGIVGVGFAFACTRLILRLAFHDQHVAISSMPSLPVLAFTFGASLLTGILFGVAPAWMMAHVDPPMLCAEPIVPRRAEQAGRKNRWS